MHSLYIYIGPYINLEYFIVPKAYKEQNRSQVFSFHFKKKGRDRNIGGALCRGRRLSCTNYTINREIKLRTIDKINMKIQERYKQRNFFIKKITKDLPLGS